MMAYLTRPKFQDGGPVVPPKKPYTDIQFKKRVDILIQGIYGTGPEYKDLAVREIQKELDKAEQEGVLSRQEGINFLRERKKYYDDYLNEQRKTTDGPLSLPSVEERKEFKKGTNLIPEGMKGSKKPQLITQGPNKGKYAINRILDGKPQRVILNKKQADEFGKLTKVILQKETGKPIWPDPKRENMFIKDLEKKLQFPAGKATPIELRASALAKKYPEISERQIERATKYYRENLNLKYKKGIGADDPTGAKTQKERREALKKKSNLTYENRLTGNEKFHKSHMSDLYTKDVRTGTIGYAKASINMEDLDDIDAKMKALYKQQEDLLKKNPKNFIISMDEINRKGTNLAAQSGGYKKFEAIDPITKKSFIINFSSAAQELDPTDILENKKLSELDTKLDKRTVETLKENALKNISKFGKYAKQIARPVTRLAAPIIPFAGPAIMASGAYDVAKAAEQGYTSPDELGAAYYLGSEGAKGLDALKEKVRGQIDETEEFVP
jgi:hypothetical protein